MPDGKLFRYSRLELLDQENIKFPVPPEAVRSIAPEPSPAHLGSVDCKPNTMACGSVKVSEMVAVQPFASVVKTV